MTKRLIAATLLISFIAAPSQAEPTLKGFYCRVTGHCHLSPIKK